MRRERHLNATCYSVGSACPLEHKDRGVERGKWIGLWEGEQAGCDDE